ncbi:unnamed protein product [Rodentolepis nana]|uniref:Uncharacterized protein n=1 Tax=Rodentolepis nana TaxID=102285 RepID=A0A0R3U0M6_RODNA|nr:unnamed protein product [Rodentolepis nana]
MEEENITSREDEDEDSECSSSLREFLMLERLCEEYEEAKQRRERRDQGNLERPLKRFRGGQLSTIEEEEEEEEEEDEEEEDSSVREIGEEYELPGDCHREEGRDVGSGDGIHIQGEKLMSLEEFCGETFAISPTFIEDIMVESRILQRRLEQAHEEFGNRKVCDGKAPANPSDLQQLNSSLLGYPPLRLLLLLLLTFDPEND